MAHFYGTIRGQRGEASRLGGKDSGLTVYAASWQGAVRECYAQEPALATIEPCSPTCGAEPYCIYPRCTLRQEAK